MCKPTRKYHARRAVIGYVIFVEHEQSLKPEDCCPRIMPNVAASYLIADCEGENVAASSHTAVA